MDRYTCEQALRQMDAYLDRELGVAALQAFRAYHTFDDIEALYLYRRTVEAGMGRADTTLYFIEDFSYKQIADVVGCLCRAPRRRRHREPRED